MTARSSTISSIFRYCLIDVIGNFLYWPLWWYSRGLQLVGIYILKAIQKTEADLGVRLMLVNMFQPMYGQNDREGRIISFVMRLVLLVSRLVVWLVVSLVWVAALGLWLMVPLVVVSRLISIFSWS